MPTKAGLKAVASPSGSGPPVAQSRSWTVCTTGTPVLWPICMAQPMLPVAITCGFSRSRLATLRSPSWPAISGCRML